MSYFGVLLVACINCALLFFTSMLAAGGDGSKDGIHMIWWVGFPWVAIFTATALTYCARRRASAALTIAAGTLPAGWTVSLLGLLLANALGVKLG
jgi:hypothetical protein